MADLGGAPLAEDKTRYENLKREIMLALPKKRAVDKQLAQVEVQIYDLEATYLTETAVHTGGNIVQGFDGYLKNQSVGRRKYEVNDHDRIFSNSSLTVSKAIELMGEGEEQAATAVDDVDKLPMPGLTTVIVPPATRNQVMSVAQQKRLRDKEYQRKKRATASLRSTGESDDETTSAVSRRPTKRARIVDDD